jgi:hypothetical protein
LSHTSCPLCSGYFGDRGSQTIFPGYPWILILPVLASPVAKVTGVSHQHPANFFFLAGLGFELRDLVLAKLALYCFSHTTSPSFFFFPP